MNYVSGYRIKMEAQTLIYEVEGLSAIAREVHFWLVKFHPLSERGCYPSVGLIARRLRKSERSVSSALHRLADAGVITIHRNQGPNGTNKYDLHLLDQKICELRPEESGTANRKKSSDKEYKKNFEDEALSDPTDTDRVASVFGAGGDDATGSSRTGGDPLSNSHVDGNEIKSVSKIDDVARFWAAKIREGGFVPPSAVTPSLADRMLTLCLVSEAELRAARIPY